MRKVLSLVLVLALVLSSFSMAFADDTAAATTTTATKVSDVDGLACEQAVKVLLDLNVVTGYPDGTYKPDANVTRAEAAVIVIKMLGLENKVGTQKSNYTDMAGYGWAEPYIAFASNLGILQGDGNGKYRPGDPVSYNEFAKIMVAALGYTADSLTGTWPANYVNKAMGLGIMDDVVSGGAAPVTRGDVAIMVSNNLVNEIGSIDKDGTFQPTQIKKGLYDSPIYRLGGTKVVDVIEDVSDAVINAREYLGKYCEYYVNSDNEIIAVKEVKSTTLSGDFKVATTKLEGDDDVDYTVAATVNAAANWGYKDEDGTEQFYYAFTNGVSGGQDGTILLADADDVTMEVKLSGKTIKEIYSISGWTVGDADKISKSEVEDITNDHEVLGYSLEENKDGSIKENSFELVGVKSLADIKEGNVVYVYAENSKDKYVRKVAVGTKTVEGNITKDNGVDKWKISGTEYSFTTAVAPKTAYADHLDDDVILYLDAYGDIYDYDVTAGSANQVAVVKDATGSFGQVKLFLADETSKVFDTDLKAAEKPLVAGGTEGTLIAYGLDKDGVVNKAEGGGTRFVKDPGAAVKSNTKLVSSFTTVGGLGTGTVEIASDVVVFTVKKGTTPGESTDSLDTVSIKDVDKWKEVGDEFAVAFLLNSDEDKVIAMIIDENNVTGNGDDSYAVVSAWDRAKNAAGDKAQELTGFIDGKKMVDVYTDDENTFAPTNGWLQNHVQLFKIKYSADGAIKDLDPSDITLAGAATSAAGLHAADGAGLQSVSAGSNLKLGTTSQTAIDKYSVADNFVMYKVTDFGTDDMEYAKFSGSIKEDEEVWLFDTDDDNPGYEVVVVRK